MKFKYSVASNLATPLYNSSGKIVKRPILWLTLTGNNGEAVNVPAIIDSGADTTTVNLQYAGFLGIDFDNSKQGQIMGIGKGKVPVNQGTFSFRIKEMGINMEVPAWYVDSENVNILLGRDVFFDLFRIKFEQDHNTFEINESRNKNP